MGEFEPGPSAVEAVKTAKVLVIGAGGLGCEILKDLALSGFRDMHVIDMDRIDLTNLNRQFLFRRKDVGRYKAEVAAEFIHKRIPGVSVTAHTCKIQDKETEFYRQFRIVVAGLDNLEARRWINSLLCSMVHIDADGNVDVTTVIPLIDGGTEGFKGQARVIIPRFTACFECSLATFPKQQAFQLCTIAETPRKPEHCIAYAMLIEWEKAFGNRKLDKDSPEDMKWIYETALARAEAYHIDGVTYMLTMGVVKNIIPAVASTNALIAAACVNEAFKAISFCSHTLNNYFMYMGVTGVYSRSFDLQRLENCCACQAPKRTWKVPASTTLKEIVERLQAAMDLYVCDSVLHPTITIRGANRQLVNPAIGGPSGPLWMPAPPALRAMTEGNLDKPLSDLISSGASLAVTDRVLVSDGMELTIVFE